MPDRVRDLRGKTAGKIARHAMLREKQKMWGLGWPDFISKAPESGMGNPNQSVQSLSATEVCASGTIVSEPQRLGRNLALRFVDGPKPELNAAEFLAHSRCVKPSIIKQRDRDHNFSWSPTPRAFSLLILEYKCAGLEGRERDFSFPGARRGSLAATLGDALKRNTGPLHELFSEDIGKADPDHCIQSVFKGRNLDGDEDNERRFEINSDYLPADRVEIYIDGEKITDSGKLRAFGLRIREAYELEPSRQLPPPEKKEKPTGQPPTQPELLPIPPKEKAAEAPLAVSKPEPSPAQAPNPFKFSKWFASELREAMDELRSGGSSKEKGAPKPKPETPKNKFFIPTEEILPGQIDPKFLAVEPCDGLWPDHLPLVAWDIKDEPYIWTLRHAFEGALIMGATGSGKTTGSGAAIAEAFLRSGFGGLVMTVKPDEAERWRRLCVKCGREKDFVVVRRGGEWKFNVMAYEAQATGRGARLSENLVALCRTLLAISSRQSQSHGLNEQFWESASAQLLNATFDLFLLSGTEPTFDSLTYFISAAPTEKVPETEEAWLAIPVFGKILSRARELAASPEDKRLLQRAGNYWFNVYSSLGSKTRASVTLGVYSMLDAFRGRDIPAIISSETNLTPESIMSGRIVVLDLPVQEVGHTGLLVQSAWKHLFQTSLQRHARSGDPHCRPVFLWEDEGQYFFSEYDHHFQATARSARVCHVVLSQNVHNFYVQFGRGGEAAANSVFGNLNTKIFHANSEPFTNEWAVKHFGQEIHSRVTISHRPPPPPPPNQSMADALMNAVDPPSTAGVSTTEHWEYAVRPEEFNTLRTGGPENDFQVDAYITWIGANGPGERHFTHITFNQDKNL